MSGWAAGILAVALGACVGAPPRDEAHRAGRQGEPARIPEYEAPTDVPGPRAYAHYVKAQMFELEGELDRALRELRAALLYDEQGTYLHVALGRLYWRLGRAEEALGEAGKALELEPGNTQAHLLAGDVRRDLKQFPGAIAEFEAALDSVSQVLAEVECAPEQIIIVTRCREARQQASGVLQELGRLHLGLKERDLAEQVYRRWSELITDRSEPWFHLGRLAEERRDLDRAEAMYRRALEVNLDDPLAYTSLAALLERRRKWAEAIALRREYLERGGDSDEEKLGIAELYLRLDDLTNARAYFDMAVVGAPGSPELRSRIGAILYDHQQYTAAVDEFLQAIKLDPRYHRARILLALARWRLDDRDAALEVLRQVPASDSASYFEAQRWIGYLLRRAGRIDEAIELLEAIRKAHPLAVEVVAELAQAYELKGQREQGLALLAGTLATPGLSAGARRSLTFSLALLLDRAGKAADGLKLVEALVAQDPDDATALNFVGYTLAEQGRDLERAEALIRRALALEPDNGYILDSLGWVLFKQGQVAEGLEILVEADRVSPREPEILAHLAEAHLALGQTDQARTILEAALTHDPEPWVKERIETRLKELAVPVSDATVH